MVTAVVLLVLVLAVGGDRLLGMWSYDAVEAGHSSGWTVDGVRANETTTVGNEVVLAYAADGEFTYSFHLANEGDRTVRVKALPGDVRFPFASATVWTSPPGPNDGGAEPDRLRPFRPFTLKPDQAVWVEYRYKLIPCPAPEGASSRTGFRTQPITYKVGLFTKTRRYELPNGIAVEGVPPGDCRPSKFGKGGGSERVRQGQSGADSVMVTDSMTTFSLGVPDRLPSASIVATTSNPETTLPNSAYCGGRRMPSGPEITKNCEPLVFGPALAIASDPSSYRPGGGSSSANL